MSDQRPADPATTSSDHDGGPTTARAAGSSTGHGRRTDAGRDLVAEEKAEFGGMRFFLAFFGWLTATGAVVLLTAIITGILAATGLQNSGADPNDDGTLRTAGVLGIVALAFVLFVGYYIGGYVAGRMARFSGLKQGLAVWLWAVIVAVLAAIAAAVFAGSTDAFSQFSSTGLPIDGTAATATGISSLVVAIVFSLAGALLGGLGGMRFHRKVDRFAAARA